MKRKEGEGDRKKRMSVCLWFVIVSSFCFFSGFISYLYTLYIELILFCSFFCFAFFLFRKKRRGKEAEAEDSGYMLVFLFGVGSKDEEK